MKESVYIETSVVSYLVSRPSNDVIVSARQKLTHEWWHRHRSSLACFVSEVVLDEAADGDPEPAAMRLRAIAGMAALPATPEGAELAEDFLRGALPSRAVLDATHLAIATVGGMDYLVTWNCKHLANAQLLNRLEPIAEAAGFKLPRVCTPEELMGVTDDD